MFLMRFTERAYVNYTEQDVRNSPNEAVRLTFSNSNFDPQEGHYLYNMYLDEYQYSEEVGFDGLMLNEHPQHADLPRRHDESGSGDSGPHYPRNPRLCCWAIRCLSSTIRSVWLRNWPKST